MNRKDYRRKNYKHRWYEKHKRDIKDDQHIEHCSYHHLVHIGKIILKRLDNGDIDSLSNYYNDINGIPRQK